MKIFLVLAFVAHLFLFSKSESIGLNISRIILASPSSQDSSIGFLFDSSQNLLISLLAETGSFLPSQPIHHYKLQVLS